MHKRTRWIIAAVLIAGAVTASPGEARALTCQDTQLHKKPPIAFRAFPLEDPRTGRTYAPNEEIEVAPGKRMLAGTFFEQVNDLEMKLTGWGYSLRETGVQTLQEIDTCLTLLAAQKSAIEADKDAHPPKPWDVEAHLQELKKKWDAYKQNIVGLEDLWINADSEAVKVNLPAPPPFTAPVPHAARVAPRDVLKKRTWSFESGSKSTFWVKGEASVAMTGSRELTKAEAHGKFFAALLGLWEGELAGVTAIGEAGKDVDPTLRLDVRLAGHTVWAPKFPSEETAPRGPAGDAAREPTSALGKVNKFLHQSDKFGLAIDEGAEWRFAIGPIPLKARLGFRGEGGLKYGFDVALTGIGGYAGPYARADAYVQLGIDIFIAGCGVEGRLLLIDDELTLRGDATVDFIDEPKLTLDLSASNKLEALSGKFSVYAYINFLFGTWRGDYSLWAWDGLKLETPIFHFNYIWTPSGARATGDVTAEDVMEIWSQNNEIRLTEIENTSKNRLHEVMRAVVEDVGSPKAELVITDRARVNHVSQAMDGNVTSYLTALRTWGGS